MSAIRPISWKKFEKFVLYAGCHLERIRGDHRVYQREDLKRPVIFPEDEELPVFIAERVSEMKSGCFSFPNERWQQRSIPRAAWRAYVRVIRVPTNTSGLAPRTFIIRNNLRTLGISHNEYLAILDTL